MLATGSGTIHSRATLTHESAHLRAKRASDADHLCRLVKLDALAVRVAEDPSDAVGMQRSCVGAANDVAKSRREAAHRQRRGHDLVGVQAVGLAWQLLSTVWPHSKARPSLTLSDMMKTELG